MRLGFPTYLNYFLRPINLYMRKLKEIMYKIDQASFLRQYFRKKHKISLHKCATSEAPDQPSLSVLAGCFSYSQEYNVSICGP